MTTSLIWFRDDLRLDHHPAILAAASSQKPMIFIYILDETAPPLEQLGGASKWWLHHSLASLSRDLEARGASLLLAKGNPSDILQQLIQAHHISDMYWTRSYTPHAIARDTKLKALLKPQLNLHIFEGNVLTEPFVVKNGSGEPYRVYTPFSKRMRDFMKPFESGALPERFQAKQASEILKLDQLNLLPTKPNWAQEFGDFWQPGTAAVKKLLATYFENPFALNLDDLGTKLAPHIRWGEVSVAWLFDHVEKLRISHAGLSAHINHVQRQLIWRDFAYMLLYQFPEIATENIRSEFNKFPWDENPEGFKAWCQGRTGFALVDAGMQQLWRVGFLPNRVRMLAGSFLVKDLFIDWRQGERWFWDTLVDADLANNAMNWQWVAGTGVDAAPYFRIFNPTIQEEKFDPRRHYIAHWLKHKTNVKIVDHDKARQRALQYYKELQ